MAKLVGKDEWDEAPGAYASSDLEAFLAAHPDFSIVPCAEVLARLGLDIPGCERWLRLLPQV